MTQTLTTGFDYNLVSKELASKLRYFEGALLTADRDHVKAIWVVGETLYLAQQELAHCHNGMFQKWVEATRPYCIKTAHNYINAWLAFKDCVNFTQIEPSAMYLLASNDDAKRAALKLAKGGQRITHKMARELIAETVSSESVFAEPDVVVSPATAKMVAAVKADAPESHAVKVAVKTEPVVKDSPVVKVPTAFERFRDLWNEADETSRAAIRVFVLEN